MEFFKYLFFTILIFSSFPGAGVAGTVTIQGKEAVEYAGMTITFMSRDDMITYTRDTLLVVHVRADGTFRGDFMINEPMKIFSELGVYEAWLFVEPGEKYIVQLPPRRDKTMKDILNPYFRPASIQLGLKNTDKEELNFQIQRFESLYNPYFFKHARDVYAEKRDNELDSFIRSVRDTFANVPNHFFQDYMKSRLTMLTVMNLPERAAVLDKYRDFGRKVHFLNPAYMDLFNQVFNRYFSYLLRHAEGIRLKSAVKKGNADSLRAVIKDDLELKYYEFVDLVALKGIYDAWYSNTFSHEQLLRLLKNLMAKFHGQKLQQIGRNIYLKFTRLQAGSMAPVFTLPDIKGKHIHLSDFRGKFVYLNFSSRLSYTSLRQFPLLSRLRQKYGKDMEILTIAPENKPDMLKEFIKEKKYTWPFLICREPCNLPVIYSVRAYPTYFLIGPDGNFILSPAPSPTENFEQVFTRILEKKGINPDYAIESPKQILLRND